jgi:hypothetical protein
MTRLGPSCADCSADTAVCPSPFCTVLFSFFDWGSLEDRLDSESHNVFLFFRLGFHSQIRLDPRSQCCWGLKPGHVCDTISVVVVELMVDVAGG